VTSELPAPGTDWHFTWLGRDYFASILSEARTRGAWPLATISTGRTGIAYRHKALGRKVRPNWQIEGVDGLIFRSLRGRVTAAKFNQSRLIAWPYEVIAREFGFPLATEREASPFGDLR